MHRRYVSTACGVVNEDNSDKQRAISSLTCLRECESSFGSIKTGITSSIGAYNMSINAEQKNTVHGNHQCTALMDRGEQVGRRTLTSDVVGFSSAIEE